MAAASDPERTFTVAVLQAGSDHYADGNPGLEANFDCLAAQARDAAEAGPDLMVFPEYAITGWPYPSEDVMRGVAEPLPGEGEWYGRYVELARQTGTPLLGWLIEREEDRLFNAAFLISQDGAFMGKYRKVHANLGEQAWWGLSQGGSLEPLELNGVKIGVSICADMWFPVRGPAGRRPHRAPVDRRRHAGHRPGAG
ncbi:MAG: carbon-nitrogen hydrolase family protein [Candidatus Brocadiia bacterium]